MEKQKSPKLIHVARLLSKGEVKYLFLRKIDPQTLVWHEQTDGNNAEKPTEIIASNVEDAMRLANRQWSEDHFRPVNCGFRYTLPERDEHGINALFWQMASSYGSSNGVYFDDDLGSNCFVNFASQEALELLKKLKLQNRI